jgi:hypothetical protein
MILLPQCIVSSYSIIVLLYSIFYTISMQICGYDAFVIALSSFTCYNTVSYYDTCLIFFACIKCMIQLMILALWLSLHIFHCADTSESTQQSMLLIFRRRDCTYTNHDGFLLPTRHPTNQRTNSVI